MIIYSELNLFKKNLAKNSEQLQELEKNIKTNNLNNIKCILIINNFSNLIINRENLNLKLLNKITETIIKNSCNYPNSGTHSQFNVTSNFLSHYPYYRISHLKRNIYTPVAFC